MSLCVYVSAVFPLQLPATFDSPSWFIDLIYCHIKRLLPAFSFYVSSSLHDETMWLISPTDSAEDSVLVCKCGGTGGSVEGASARQQSVLRAFQWLDSKSHLILSQKSSLLLKEKKILNGSGDLPWSLDVWKYMQFYFTQNTFCFTTHNQTKQTTGIFKLTNLNRYSWQLFCLF